MAQHFTNSMSIDNMEIRWVGFNPETAEAHIDFQLVVPTEGQTVFMRQELTIPLELLNTATNLLNCLALELSKSGSTEFELRSPDEVQDVLEVI